MIVISIWAFLLLGGFLLLTALRFGVPDMVSSVYYQLDHTTDSTVLGGTTEHKRGWIFSVVMIMSAFLMMVCMLDTGRPHRQLQPARRRRGRLGAGLRRALRLLRYQANVLLVRPRAPQGDGLWRVNGG